MPDEMLTEAQRRGYRMSPEIIELVSAARKAIESGKSNGGGTGTSHPDRVVQDAQFDRLADALIPFEGVQYAEKPA